MQGAALMQALARVNRPFREQAGWPHRGLHRRDAETRRCAQRIHRTDQAERPIGTDVEAAAEIVREQHGVIVGILRGYDWQSVLFSGKRNARLDATLGVIDYLCDPVRAENLRGRGESDLAQRFGRLSASCCARS